MKNKNQIRIINFILCLAILAFAIPIEALAMDNPESGYIEVFPVPGDPDTVIVENYGTINYAKTGGSISYNFHIINNLEGATVGVNKKGGTIGSFVNGRVENNFGTINKVTNSASVGTNTSDGVIKENSNNVDKNMGTIEKQYSGTIGENYGNVGTLGASATIEKLYEGTVTENSGNIVICPEPGGILTLVKIGTNKNSVRIEADTENKSSVVIDSNEADATLHVCAGADCTVIDNAGKIEIEEGASCNITGTNTGEVTGEHTTPGEEYVYELILDNVENPSDISFVDFFKKSDGKIYVMNGEPDHNVIVTYDTNKYYCSTAFEIKGVKAIPIMNSDCSVVDDENKTFTIHFHSMGEFEPSSDGKHKRKCGGTWNGSKCTVTFKEESCNLTPATCTSKAKCEKCGTEYGDELPHSYNWVWDNGKHKQVCSECGATTNVGDCSYGEWIIDIEAKVGVTGKKHRVCSVCKGVENATIPAKTDSGNKKADNEQGGNEQDINPTKEDDGHVVKPTKADTAQAIKPTTMDGTQGTNPTKADISQEVKPTKADAAQKINSINKNTAQDENTLSEDDAIQKEDDSGLISGEDIDIDSDSKTEIADSESSEREHVATEDFENNGTVSSTSRSKIGIIAGVSGLAIAAVTAGFFIISRKKGARKVIREAFDFLRNLFTK